MDMLSEMTSYLKTANTSGGSNQLDAATLLSMYDNSYTGWSDQELVGNGKQLKSKTALEDTGVQAQFEAWMTEAAAATPPTEDGYYLQAATGQEWTQLIEKGLMSACFASQLTANYLNGIMEDDNVQIVDYQNDIIFTRITKYHPMPGSIQNWGFLKYIDVDNVDLWITILRGLHGIGLIDLTSDITTPNTFEDGESKEFYENYGAIMDSIADLSNE